MREYLLWLREHATVVEVAGGGLFAGATPDPDDDYLIAVAAGSAAEVLVSGDSHLLDLETNMTSGISTTIVTPREFLDQMEHSG